MKKLTYLLTLSFIPLVSCNKSSTYTVNKAQFDRAIINEGKEYLQLESHGEKIQPNGKVRLQNGNDQCAPKVSHSYMEAHDQDQNEIPQFEECFAKAISDTRYKYVKRDQSEPEYSDWEYDDISEDDCFYSQPKDRGLKAILKREGINEVKYSDFSFNKEDKQYHASYDFTNNYDTQLIECDVQFINGYVTLVHIKIDYADVGHTEEETTTFTYEKVIPEQPIDD